MARSPSTSRLPLIIGTIAGLVWFVSVGLILWAGHQESAFKPHLESSGPRGGIGEGFVIISAIVAVVLARAWWRELRRNDP